MSGPANDRGETLLEVLIAVVIMGIAIVAIIGGLVTSVLLSDVHRKQATAGAAVHDYAEAIANTVATTGTDNSLRGYQACATTTTYQSPAGYTAVAGYRSSVVSVAYWNGTGWQSTCASDIGLQQLKVQVASTDGRASEQLTIIVRRPCGLGPTLC